MSYTALFSAPARLKSIWVLALPLMLAGCAPVSVPPKVQHVSIPAPTHQIADYHKLECPVLWKLHGQLPETNSVYWLRMMDCAAEMTPAQARQEASRWTDDSWEGAYKRSILLGKAKITPQERSKLIDALDAMYDQVPLNQRTLFQLWRDGQASEYQLSQARTRYSKLQQSSDKELDDMHREQQQLHRELIQTQSKLQSLTDIERQLSSRKSSALDSHSSLPDGDRHDDDSAQPDTQPAPSQSPEGNQ
ncbi:membrane protein [Salmonella enterica subsp. enterica serovar Choleraesuis]|nr:membrane protein [Salmonella enterica subsp. enterica serovar Choleraesuis]